MTLGLAAIDLPQAGATAPGAGEPIDVEWIVEQVRQQTYLALLEPDLETIFH